MFGFSSIVIIFYFKFINDDDDDDDDNFEFYPSNQIYSFFFSILKILIIIKIIIFIT
jgi:hypothetical protein